MTASRMTRGGGGSLVTGILATVLVACSVPVATAQSDGAGGRTGLGFSRRRRPRRRR